MDTVLEYLIEQRDYYRKKSETFDKLIVERLKEKQNG